MPDMEALQEEFGRGAPFRSPQQALVLSLIRTSDEIGRVLDGVVAAHGISLKTFNVLRILRGAGPEGLPTLTVAERMVERSPGVTRLLDRLDREGFIERRRDTEDRRRVVARITEHGRQILDVVDPLFAEAEDGLFESLTHDEVLEMLSRLARVRRTLERHSAP
jgi:MarR family transcriptional regulator, organic hydroperoxide resistance regulator